MPTIQQITSDLLQTWPNFQRTTYDIFPWHPWLFFIPLFFLSFGVPFVDAFFCLRTIHRLQPRFPGDADVPRYKAARTKLILATCLLYGLSFFLTHPNVVKDPTCPNPSYLYAIGVVLSFIASINYRRSGLFISTVLASLFSYANLFPVLDQFLDGPEANALGLLIFMLTLMSFVFPADAWAYRIFKVYGIDYIAATPDSDDEQATEYTPAK